MYFYGFLLSSVFGLAAKYIFLINLVLITGIMSLLGATLTLPGIAGIVLTVGMAVDANVLIFARIREELKEKDPQTAIRDGFSRAFITIFDANVTTLIAALNFICYWHRSSKRFCNNSINWNSNINVYSYYVYKSYGKYCLWQ